MVSIVSKRPRDLIALTSILEVLKTLRSVRKLHTYIAHVCRPNTGERVNH